MHKPPFKLAPSLLGGAAHDERDPGFDPIGCCEPATVAEPTPVAGRARLGDLDQHLHCSVIGTCLGTAELRKLMSRFIPACELSDLEVHHESVRLACEGGPAAKALSKALDQRHEAAIQRFARTHDEPSLAALWDAALGQGEVPGAYWAIVTHRHVTPSLRQRAFGDVHMLSHLVGAANRADIRRLVALERENAELRERSERQQLRSQEALEDRDRTIAVLRQQLVEARAEADRAGSDVAGGPDPSDPARRDDLAAAAALVAVQTERRERAEQAAAGAANEVARLQEELDHLARHARGLGQELVAVETQLRELGDGTDGLSRSLEQRLRRRRVLYVGGRPSSTPAIRDIVLRHGGEFEHHDGGFEDRKGLLASGVAWAHLVVFPVDCVDHDSATNLKRLCTRQQVTFLPLRSASVASFAAGVANPADSGGDSDSAGSPICVRHG